MAGVKDLGGHMGQLGSIRSQRAFGFPHLGVCLYLSVDTRSEYTVLFMETFLFFFFFLMFIGFF